MKLYHITSINNIENIIEGGLKPNNDGYVFLFENATIPYCEGFYKRGDWSPIMREYDVQNIIAKNQLFLSEYALFEVEVDGLDLMVDYCKEETYIYQKKVKAHIITDRINFVGTFKTKPYYCFPKLKAKYHPKGKIIRIGDMGWVDAKI